MKIFLILTTILFTTHLFAESVHFDIAKIDFQRPEKNVGRAGTVQFNKFSLFYYDFMSEITNEDGRFNAKLFVRKNFLGLTANQIKLGTYTKPGDMLHSLQKTTGTNLKIVLDSKKVSVKADELSLKTPLINMQMNGASSLFCQKANSYRGNSPEDLEKACVHYLNFIPTGEVIPQLTFENIPSPEDLEGEREAEDTTEEQSYLYFSGAVEQFELADQRINFKSNNLKLNLDKTYLIRSKKIDFNCAKKQIDTLDSDQLLQFCLHDFEIKPNQVITVNNLEDNSSFAFFPSLVQLKDQLLQFATPEFIISYPGEGDTILSNMAFSCYMDQQSDATDVSAYVNGCLNQSQFTIRSLDNSNKQDKKKGYLRNIVLKIHQGKITMTSEVKFLMKFHLSLQATASYNPATKVLQAHINKAVLPMGIKSTKLLMYFIRKLVASDTVKVSGKDIFISL